MNQHLCFGPFDVIRLAECPDVAFLGVQGSMAEIVIAKSELSDLRRALDWLEAEWGGGVEQPRLPLGPHDQQ